MNLEFIGNKIAAAFWNREVIGMLRKEDAAPGANVRISKFPSGQLVGISDSAMYHHPWFTSPRWNPDTGEKGAWEITVRPGFVNGLDPLVGKVPLIDADPITLGAFMPPASWPKFFDSLGVQKDRQTVIVNLAMEKIQVDTTYDNAPPTNRRWLQKCDVFLSVSRPTYKMTADIQGNLVMGQIVEYTATYDTSAMDAAGTRARLNVAAEMPPKPDTSFSMRLMGSLGDDGEDRALVSTVYFLSPDKWQPPSEGPTPPPDSNWTPFVGHSLFWNLCHASKNLPPENVKQTDLSGVSALTARYTVAPMATLGAMQAQSQLIIEAANNASTNEGKFWTV